MLALDWGSYYKPGNITRIPQLLNAFRSVGITIHFGEISYH